MDDIAWDDVFGVRGVLIWPFWSCVVRILGQFLLGSKKNARIRRRLGVSWSF